MSKLELDIVACAGIHEKVADTLPGFLTNGTNKTPIDDNVPVLMLTCQLLAQEWKPLERNEDESISNENAVEAPVLFLPKIDTPADRVWELETNIPDLPDFKQQQKSNDKYSQAGIAVGISKQRLQL